MGLLASIGGAYLATQIVLSDEHLEAETEAERLVHDIEEGFSTSESLLNIVARAGDPATANPLEGFRGMLIGELLANHYPTVSYLAFFRRLQSSELPNYERSMQSQFDIDESGLSRFRLQSIPDRKEHLLLETLIPASRNASLGAEIRDNAELLLAMEAFRRGAASAIVHLESAPVAFGKSPDLLVAPVWVWDRLKEKDLSGILVLGLGVKQLAESVLNQNPFKNWGIRIASSSARLPEGNWVELYSRAPTEPGGWVAVLLRPNMSRAFQFGGTTLVVEMQPELDRESLSELLYPLTVLLVGSLASALLYFLLRQLRTSRTLAENNASRLGREAEQNNQRFRDLVESSSDWIWEVDREYRFRYVSPTTQAYFGIPPEKLTGRSIQDLIERSAIHGARPFPFPLDQPAAYSGFERSFVGANGSVLTFESTGTPIIDEFRGFCGMRGIDRDVTAQRNIQARLSALRQDLSMSMQANLVNQLLSGLAHELNQPLSAIASYNQACVRLLNQEPIDWVEIKSAMQATTSHALLAAEVVSRVRRLTVQRTPQITDVDLSAVVLNTVHLIQFRTSSSDIAIDVDVPESLPHAAADPILVTQVLLNILNNAVDAMSESPVRQIRVVGEVMKDGQIRLSVTDSGPGMGTLDPDRVFEPYFTTKTDGMGLGLTISRSIIEALEGTLNHAPNPSGGTIFTMTLPAIALQ